MKERRQVARDRKVEGFRVSGADEKKLKCPRSSAKNSAMKKKTLLSLFALVLCVPVAGTLFFALVSRSGSSCCGPCRRIS